MQGELVTLIKGNTFQLSVAASRYTQLSDKPQENCENANVLELPKQKLSLVSAPERLAGSNLEGKEEDGRWGGERGGLCSGRQHP